MTYRCARVLDGQVCGATLRRHSRNGVCANGWANGACAQGWSLAGDGTWFVAADSVECRCEGFEEAAPPTAEDRKRKGSRRSIRSYAINAQRHAALAGGFHPREGHGADCIFYGPDGFPLLVGEHKHRPAPGFWKADIDQARSYALYEKGRPFGVAIYTSKPGPGVKAKRYLMIDLEDWQGITERLWNGDTK